MKNIVIVSAIENYSFSTSNEFGIVFENKFGEPIEEFQLSTLKSINVNNDNSLYVTVLDDISEQTIVQVYDCDDITRLVLLQSDTERKCTIKRAGRGALVIG